MPHKESLRNWRIKQRARGLCIDCINPATSNLRRKIGVYCGHHRDLHREHARVLRHKKNGTPALPFPLDAFLEIPPLDLAYAAGLIDGEGGLTIYKFRGRIRIGIAVGMTEREPVDFMARTFGGKVHSYDPKRKNRKRVYHWARRSRIAAAVVSALLPYLKIPRKIKEAKAIMRAAEVLEIAYQYENSVVDGMLAKRKAVEDDIAKEFDLKEHS